MPIYLRALYARYRRRQHAIWRRKRFIKPRCPWTNGRVEHFNRTLAAEWAYSRVSAGNDERTAALAPWLNYYNTDESTAASEQPASAECHKRHDLVNLGLPPNAFQGSDWLVRGANGASGRTHPDEPYTDAF
ncbi:hypothetical protein E3N94_02860 [Cryobacterium sp. Sr3]|nr:hypothetical protein E3N94_02860 [Cryobacterium sp. Sr3]